MRSPRPYAFAAGRRARSPRVALASLLAVAIALAAAPPAFAASEAGDCPQEDTAADDCGRGALEPSYAPRPAEGPETYTTDYYFSLSRAVASSTLVPAARVPLFFLTIPIDVAFLPVAALAGFFPGD